MPAKPVTINLLGEETIAHTPQGRIVQWALTYGRYIMIGTEIVVLLAFISRFSLDRKLTDLKEEISQKQAILEANLPLENDIRSLQDRLSRIKSVITEQKRPVDAITFTQTILPPDVYLTSLDIIREKLILSLVAGTAEGFSRFLANFQSSKTITNTELQDVHRDPVLGISFKVSAKINPTASKTSP